MVGRLISLFCCFNGDYYVNVLLLSPGLFEKLLCQALGGHFADVGRVVGRSGGLQQIVMMDVMSVRLAQLLLLSVMLLLLVMRRRSVMMLLMFALVTAVVVVSRAIADRTLLLLALTTGLLVNFLDGSELLLELHASILKPNFDLTLRQAKGVSDFDPPPPRQVVIKVKLFLQFERLVARVSLAASPSRAAIRSFRGQKKKKKRIEKEILGYISMEKNKRTLSSPYKECIIK